MNMKTLLTNIGFYLLSSVKASPAIIFRARSKLVVKHTKNRALRPVLFLHLNYVTRLIPDFSASARSEDRARAIGGDRVQLNPCCCREK